MSLTRVFVFFQQKYFNLLTQLSKAEKEKVSKRESQNGRLEKVNQFFKLARESVKSDLTLLKTNTQNVSQRV